MRRMQGSGSTEGRADHRGGRRNLVLGRVAGLLFLCGAMASLPTNVLLSQPDPGGIGAPAQPARPRHAA